MWIGRSEALEELGVQPQTLYAYVSRGLIASKPDADDPRSSLYAAADIAALVKRRRSGRGRQAIARAAIAWGEPVMETAITTVQGGKLIYRGKDAVRLAADATLPPNTCSARSGRHVAQRSQPSTEALPRGKRARAVATTPTRVGAERAIIAQNPLSAQVNSPTK